MGDASRGAAPSTAVGLDPVGTVLRFFRALDDREYAVLGRLLAPGGVWHRQGAELRTQADIDAAMAKRSPTQRIHHLFTNLYAEPHGPDEADVTGYMLVVRHEPGAALHGPAPLRGIESIRTTRARLRRTAEGWRIAVLGGDPPSFTAGA